MGVDIKIDTTTPDLVMTGLKQTVYKGMTQITIKELQKAQEAQLTEANAKLQQNTVQWAWRGEEGEWIDFDFESNKVFHRPKIIACASTILFGLNLYLMLENIPLIGSGT